MSTLTQRAPLDCPRCRQPQPRGTHHCLHCGARMVVRPEQRRLLDEYSGVDPWLYLGLGLVTAPVLAFLPVLSFMGWFLSSLVHEMGHACAAWLCGMPAFPAISLEGHAAAVHSEQFVPLALLFTFGMCFFAWRALEGRTRYVVCGAIVLVHSLLCYTGAREVLHLSAGHLAEYAFACMCLFRALSGGYTSSRTERALHGTLGWYLLGKNLWLCWGLVTSGGARALYHSNGSFGMTNDYIRLADDVLGWQLQTVAGGMLLVGACVLPAAFVLWRFYERARD
ncbi:MAG: hypothetical protein IPJ19_12170 [Planctomycetes bacterium]|nr:hypothetical protein [Planctomycetota bacterium]